MMELAPGSTLGAYVITGQIGRGGMATVYQAHHPALDRHVAIKVLWPSLAETPGFLERFRREARAASRLRHPNILTVYDFGSQDGITYMVTELLPGGSLADRLGRPVPLTDAARVARAIGAALDVAHQAGLIHRDVKPSNILFTRDSEPVLADFGIARLLESEQNLTVQGSLIGTPHYMAPEMAAGEDVVPASDLYGLGVVLYEMLTGGPPFPRHTPLATVRAHITETPPPLSQTNPSVPYAVQEVITRALAKRPADRFPNGAALAAAFEGAILHPDVPTPRPGYGAPLPPAYQPPAPSYPPAAPYVAPQPSYPPPQPAPPPQPSYSPSAPTQYRPIGQQPQYPTYGQVIPGPPTPQAPGSWPGYQSTGQRPHIPDDEPHSPVGLILAIVIVVMAAVAAFMIRWTGLDAELFGASPTATRTGGAAPVVTVTVSPGQPTVTLAPAVTPPVAAVSPAASPVAAPEDAAPPPASPSPETQPPTPIPTAPPTPTVPAPTVTPDPRRGPLSVQIVSPTNGAAVPARPQIAGRRTGLQGPDDHLWLMLHPDGGPDNWWPYKGEIIVDREGGFKIEDLEIGGAAGTRHVLVLGVADAVTHQAIQAQIRDHQDEPFVGGLPNGFRELARVTVVKR